MDLQSLTLGWWKLAEWLRLRFHWNLEQRGSQQVETAEGGCSPDFVFDFLQLPCLSFPQRFLPDPGLWVRRFVADLAVSGLKLKIWKTHRARQS